MKLSVDIIVDRFITVLLLLFTSITLVCYSPGKSIAKTGENHISDYKNWFGEGLADDVSKELNEIIDTVPWYRGNNAGGGNHRLHWGHNIEWYFGEKPSKETKEVIKKWAGKDTTDAQAEKLYYKHLKGGGKELLIKRIRKSYPRLSRQNAEIIADSFFAVHVEGDMPTMDKKSRELIGKKLRKMLLALESPSAEIVEAVLAINAMKEKGSNISDKAAAFLRAPENQQRLVAVQIVKSEKKIKMSNPKDKEFIGIIKDDRRYIIYRGPRKSVENLLNKYADYNILVSGDLYDELKNNPQFSEQIKTGRIVPESKILSKKTVQEISNDNLQKESEQLIARGEGLYAASKLRAFYERIPKDIRISIKAGGVAALFSGIGNAWSVIQGEKKIDEAAMETLGTGIHAGTSLYFTNAIIQRVGNGKYALTAIVDASAKELFPGISTSVAVRSAFLNYGVATFIFDETKSVFFFVKGDMDINKFMVTTGKNILTSTGSGLATMCAVVLGSNPAGFTVMAVSIGGYLIVNHTISYAERLNKRNYLFIEDILGHLPLEMQRRVTPWDREYSITPWNRQERQTPWENSKRVTPWD